MRYRKLETLAGRLRAAWLGMNPYLMRVVGLLGVLALVACGSTGAPGSSDETPGAPSDAPAGNPFTFTPPAESGTGATDDDAKGPYPILLLHGMAGFDKLSVGPIQATYFTGVVEDLAAHGEEAYLTVAPPYDSSEVRAAAIAKQIDEVLARTGKRKVNLIGHSQGGLDARVLASPNGLAYADRIASVTTIATPHRGTKVADLALGIINVAPKKQADDVIGFVLKLVQRTAYDLQTDSSLRAQVGTMSEKYMAEVFNPLYVDAPNVSYTSYAGRTNKQTGAGVCDDAQIPNEPKKLDSASAPLLPTTLFLQETEKETNDGLVPVESAKWGTFMQCVPADHMKEVGIVFGDTSFDHRQFIRDIVERLRKSGF